MVKTKDMARELAAQLAGYGYTVYTEPPKRVDSQPFIYFKLCDMRANADTPGLCAKDIGVEVISADGDGMSDASYYAFCDICTSVFLPYARFCGRSAIPREIVTSRENGTARFCFRLAFADDIETDETADIMREINLKEEI